MLSVSWFIGCQEWYQVVKIFLSQFQALFGGLWGIVALVAFSALTLLVGWQEERPACKKNMGNMVEVGTG